MYNNNNPILLLYLVALFLSIVSSSLLLSFTLTPYYRDYSNVSTNSGLQNESLINFERMHSASVMNINVETINSDMNCCYIKRE